MIINEKSIDIKEFQRGINIILEAFNEQKEQYINIINIMKEKIIFLEKQVKKLTEDNAIYQNKLHTLQKNIKCISKSICQLKDDEMLINTDEENNDNIIKREENNLNEKESFINSIVDKNKSNYFLEKNNMNQIDLLKIENKKHKNKLLNNLNCYSREKDILANKKDKIYKKAINKVLNNKIMNNKKETKDTNNKVISDNII